MSILFEGMNLNPRVPVSLGHSNVRLHKIFTITSDPNTDIPSFKPELVTFIMLFMQNIAPAEGPQHHEAPNYSGGANTEG